MNLILTAVVLLWIQLFVALVPTWRDGEYYSYGWFVPFIVAGLAWRRWNLLPSQSAMPGTPVESWQGRVSDASAPLKSGWRTRLRPDDAQPHSSIHKTFNHSRILSPIGAILLVLAVLLIAPLRLIGLADPGWRPPLLLHVSLVVGLSHFLLWRAFGRRVSLFFLPVTIVALTAVPWPWQFEQHLIRSLTGLVLAITREWFLLGGNPVELLGERLAMGGEVVEVTDGCSGIRSLQSLVMVSLFFGELFLLSTPRRIGLLLLAGVSGIGFNTLRACWLASVHFAGGREAAAAAHDRIGHTTFLLSAATLWLVAYLLLHTTHRPQSILRRTVQGPGIRGKELGTRDLKTEN